MTYGEHRPTESRDDFRTVTVRLTSTLHNTIEAVARGRGETFAATLRALLRDSVEHRDQAVSQ